MIDNVGNWRYSHKIIIWPAEKRLYIPLTIPLKLICATCCLYPKVPPMQPSVIGYLTPLANHHGSRHGSSLRLISFIT